MCGGGGGQAPDNSAQIRMQEQQMALQREQMAMQQEQANAQKAQYQEQLAISKAPPPPAPNEGAKAATAALENPMATSPQNIRAGVGRRKLRTDIASAALSIPGVA
jgi:hypothetical protein